MSHSKEAGSPGQHNEGKGITMEARATQGRHNDGDVTKAMQQGEGDVTKSDATGATCDNRASRRGPHVHVREGERSANEKEREKKTNQVGRHCALHL